MGETYGFLIALDKSSLYDLPKAKYYDEMMQKLKSVLVEHYGGMPGYGQIRPFAVVTEGGELYHSSRIFGESAAEAIEELRAMPKEERWQWTRLWMMREVAYDLQGGYDGITSEILTEGESIAEILDTINRAVPPKLASLYSTFAPVKFVSRAEQIAKAEAVRAGEPEEPNRTELATIFEYLQTSNSPPFIKGQFIPDQYYFYDTRPELSPLDDSTSEPGKVKAVIFAHFFKTYELEQMTARGEDDPVLNPL